MISISHRGNTSGLNQEKENSPQYIVAAIEQQYNVEIDVWLKDNKLYLGHDEPKYSVSLEFLKQYEHVLWCHAKNQEALNVLLQEKLHCFWHQNDDYVLTSRGYVWCYPNSTIPDTNGICLLPETTNQNYTKAVGICSDFIKKYRSW